MTYEEFTAELDKLDIFERIITVGYNETRGGDFHSVKISFHHPLYTHVSAQKESDAFERALEHVRKLIKER